MTAAQIARIKRMHESAAQLLREAHELAQAAPRDVRDVTARAADVGALIMRDWAQLQERRRQEQEARSREAAELEEFGHCTKCGTGASAEHKHCQRCDWPLYAFGSRAEQCHNRSCALFERPQDGVRYSSKEETPA